MQTPSLPQVAQTQSEAAAAECSVYKRAFGALREGKPDEKEEAVMVLEAWRGLEQQSVAAAEPGSAAAADRQAALQAVEKRMPRRVKRKRPILTEDGLEAGMEVRILCQWLLVLTAMWKLENIVNGK